MKMKTLALALGMSLAFQVAPAQAAPSQRTQVQRTPAQRTRAQRAPIQRVPAQSTPADTVQSVDNIVAVVDNEVITRRELDQAVAQFHGNGSANDPAVQRQALMQLINQSLLVQAGRRNNVQVPDAEVEAEIARIAASRRQNVAQYEAAQARLGISKTDLRRQVRDSMISQHMLQGYTAAEAKVSEDEINAAIARARAQGIALPQAEPKTRYHAQHILIASQGERAQRLAQRLSQDAQRGADFAALARQYSQDGSAANGGDLGWLSEGETVPEFERAMRSLKPGQVSQPVHTQFGWHVIRLVEAGKPNTPDARIRAGVHDAIAEQKTQAAMQGLLQQLHQNSFISIRIQ
ncbi:peptidylprolyl isomerase [Eikenella halliae]|uniref:peptidylprolyl isomerase n=1 Tax=Eikenella halliae TaxID=1795832 RepID=UPI00361BF0A0